MKPLNNTIIFILLFFFNSVNFAQYILPKHYKLVKNSNDESSLPSNSISQMAIEKNIIWIGTSNGLAKSLDTAKNWIAFTNVKEFMHSGIYSLDVFNDTIWTSTGFGKRKDNENIPTGSGYTFSTDGGITWRHAAQTLDKKDDTVIVYGINRIKALPVIVPEQNVTYDLSIAAGKVWIASWASGLRYSRIDTINWQRVVLPPDNLSSIKPTDTLNFYFDPRRNNNFLAFSVLAIDSDTIWCGTAGGINKSTDGGISWIKFNRQNQNKPILGNWVITIRAQTIGNRKIIWTTNWKADSPEEEYGVSYTTNGGESWINLLKGIKAYDFAFKDSTVYIATAEGLYKTTDFGVSFTRSGLISDDDSKDVITTSSIYTVGVIADYVIVGTGDGLAITIDNEHSPFGSEWKILRKFQKLENIYNTYCYPNPFSPKNEYTRIHYKTPYSESNVSIEIFDYGMNRVRTLIQDAARRSNTEFDELWNGRDDSGNEVSNGVYFYRITINNSESIWGKIIVLK